MGDVTKTLKTTSIGDSFVPQRGKAVAPKEPVVVTQSSYSKAKSISSDQYFGNDKKEDEYEKNAKMTKFSGSRAISSADYFERDESSMGNFQEHIIF